MKKIIIVLLHIGYWALYLSIVTSLFYSLIPDSAIRLLGVIDTAVFLTPLGIGTIAPGLVGFYTAYSILFNNYLVQKRILTLSTWMVAISLMTAIITLLIIKISFIPPKYHIAWRIGIYINFGVIISALTLIHGILGLIMKGFITSYSDLKLKAEMKVKNYEMELALMKAQMNPHFLFNTINNIDMLIQKDASKASEYLNKLSGIMRFTLYETKNQKIALDKELSYIEKYIDLQKIRTTNLNYVKYDVKGSPGNLLIEPMLFIPFIENAFKHSENKKVEDAIIISFVIEKNKIEFSCENAYSTDAQLKPEYGGLGNELIQRRLALLYPGKHTFEVINKNGIYKVTLLLSL